MSGLEIPLIDLAPWFEGGEEQRREVADLVDQHLQAVGFLLVENHGIDRSVFDDARQAVRAFSELDADVKARYGPSGVAYRGWAGLGTESNAGAYGIDTPPDLKETFAVGNPDATAELCAANPRFYGGNIYPDDTVPQFRPAVDRFIRECLGLVDELLRLLAVALRLPDETLASLCQQAMCSASLNWYVPARLLPDPVADGQYRIGPHTDYGTITVLDRQPGLGGLEVRVGDDWITAPWVEGALTVNTGLLMGRWSNDRWTPNEHRVLAPPAEDPDEEMISLVLFHDPDHDAVIAPLEGCYSDDNPPRYEPVVAAEHLAKMLDGLRGT